MGTIPVIDVWDGETYCFIDGTMECITYQEKVPEAARAGAHENSAMSTCKWRYSQYIR